MGIIKNIVGKRFGKVVAIRESGQTNDRHIKWECLCDCGNSKVIEGKNLRLNRVYSCGCAGRGYKLSEKTKALMSRSKWKGLNSHTVEYRQRKHREWKENNREKANLFKRLYSYRKAGAKGSHTLGEWEILKKQYGFTCPNCKKSEPDIKLTEDHIIPITKGGSNFIENIQPLCRACNSSKGIKVISFEPM